MKGSKPKGYTRSPGGQLGGRIIRSFVEKLKAVKLHLEEGKTGAAPHNTLYLPDS